jgi:nucleosome assembly protein 1-like 1
MTLLKLKVELQMTGVGGGGVVVPMKNNDVLAEVVSERDERALRCLKDIKWCGMEDSKGFKLKFFFDLTSYFKNCLDKDVYWKNA